MRRTIGLVSVLGCSAVALFGVGSCTGGDDDDDNVIVQTSCPTGQTMCNGACADLTRDPLHCGQCGQACGDGEVCFDSACALSCPGDLAECGGTCVNTNNDSAHCGGCNAPCAEGEICSTGQCGCLEGLTACSGSCVNTDSDRDHCGGCDAPCGDGEVCSLGDCAVSCQEGLTDCSGDCVDTDNDRNNCGGCGTTCSSPFFCEAGECVEPVELQFISVSDWHSQLDTFGVGNPAINVGGAAVLSSYFAADRALNANTVTLSAGDSFGASPPLSAFFDEEPTVYAMGLMGFDASIFGNHGFDRGIDHLQSLVDLDPDDFVFVSSNLDNLTDELQDVEQPYYLMDVGGVRVAIIGIETPETEGLVFPGRMGTLEVTDPVTAAMAARSAAEAEGAVVFVALTHLGSETYDPETGNYTGPLVDFASDVSGFHLIIGGHTHNTVSTTIGDAVVVQSGTKASTYARVSLLVSPVSGLVFASHSQLVSAIAASVTPDTAVEDMLAPYRADLAAEMDAEIGVANALFDRGNNIERLGEVPIGNLMCDALLDRYGTDFAVTNGGGLRAPLPSSYAPVDLTLRRTAAPYVVGPPFDLVKGDVFAVLPYGNIVVTKEITGTTLWAMLENGVSALPAPAGKFLQIAGFKFTYDVSQPVGSRIVSVMFPNNTAIPEDGTVYTLATNDFMNSGGDGYTMLADGEGNPRDVMADVLLDYIVANEPLTPYTDGRIAEAN